MRQIEVGVLESAVNNWVIQLPGRAFPGVVIQGDSLRILCGLAEQLAKLTVNGTEARELAEEMHDIIQGRLVQYEETLSSHGMKLPYSNPVTG